MLAIFKNFTPQTVILLLIFAIILKLGYIIQPIDLNYFTTNNNGTFLGKYILEFSSSFPKLSLFFALIINTSLALIINRLSTEYKLFPQDSFIPASLYIILSSLSPWFNILTPALLANTLAIFALNNILRINTTTMPKKLMYNCGLFLGISSLIYWPTLIYIPFVLWSYIISKKFDFKEILAAIFGHLTVIYIYIATIFLTTGNLNQNTLSNLQPTNINLSTIKDNAISIIILMTATGIGAIGLQKNFNKSLENTKKMWWSIIIFLIFSTLLPFLKWEDNITTMLGCLIPCTLLSAHIWLVEYNKYIRIAVFWILILSTIIVQYNLIKI